MSYNGIGLQTARGSGTSGHVQTSLAKSKQNLEDDFKSGNYKKRKVLEKANEKREKQQKMDNVKSEARSGISDHERKREIQVKCMELRERLEDLSEDEDEIERKVIILKDKLSKSKPEEQEAETSKSEGEDVKLSEEEAKLKYVPRFNDSRRPRRADTDQ